MKKRFSKPELSRKINGDIPFDDKKSDGQPESTQARLDIVTLERYPNYSRATIQKFIKDGRVAANGTIIKKPNQLINEESQISLQLPTSEAGDKPPVIYDQERRLYARSRHRELGQNCSSP